MAWVDPPTALQKGTKYQNDRLQQENAQASDAQRAGRSCEACCMLHKHWCAVQHATGAVLWQLGHTCAAQYATCLATCTTCCTALVFCASNCRDTVRLGNDTPRAQLRGHRDEMERQLDAMMDMEHAPRHDGAAARWSGN